MTGRLFLKSLLATLLMPGVVTLLVPYLILQGSGSNGGMPAFSFRTVIAAVMGVAGLVLLVHAISGFAIHGKGTLAPVDPPKTLVLRGLYSQTRNPMYVGVISILAAEALFLGSVALLLYASAVFLLFHAFVLLYEEPHLRARFGEGYERYCRQVPRWPLSSHTGRGKRKDSSEGQTPGL